MFLEALTEPLPVLPPLLLNGSPFTIIELLEDVSLIAVILPPPITNLPILTYHGLLMFALPLLIEPVHSPDS